MLSNDGSIVQFFCNPDKNRAQVRREVLCRNLCQILDGPVASAGKKCYTVKSANAIFIERRLLVTVFVINEHKAKLEWNDPFLASIPAIDKEAVEASFCAIAAGQPP